MLYEVVVISSYRNQLGNVSAYSTPIIVKRFQPKEIAEWLLIEIGMQGKDWLRFYNGYDEDRFYFASEEDKVKFILRWL